MATSVVKPIGLVIPTRWEAAEIIRRFRFKKIARGLYESVLRGQPVLLAISGVGRSAAQAAAARLVEKGAGELVSMGYCGALVPELKVGDLLTDRMATVDRPVRTPAERRALTLRANALAVDMETQAIIEEGTRRGVPIHIRRVVSDTFEEDLTPLFGSHGSFSAWRIAVKLLDPRVWGLVRRLWRHSDLAAAKLAEALGRYPQI